MLFNSLEFLAFFIVVTILFYLLPVKWRWFWIIAASCYFYMTFVPIYILILGGTIVLDYYAGILIERSEENEKRQYWTLAITVALNILILGVFKYYNFFIENVNLFGFSFPHLNIILPIGLSFHTFQALSYIFEIYRGKQKAERQFSIYAVYVMFYPQLVAGPIERPQNVLPQFKVNHQFSWLLFYEGIRLMVWGFFKKVVVADRLSIYVDILFNPQSDYHNYLNVIIGAVFFLIQIYCDFSGYSDIAIGAAKTLGIDLMVNFNRPLESKSISEFWRRWHISLSSWFNDYFFNSVSASTRRWGLEGIAIAVILTFALSGLWHGAAWTFIIFGLFHGIAIVFELYTQKQRTKISKFFPKKIWFFLCWLITFLFACFVLIFFRAHTIPQAITFLKDIFTLNHGNGFRKVIFSPDKTSLTTFSGSALIFSSVLIFATFLIEKKTTPTFKELNNKPILDILFMTFCLVTIFLFGVFQRNTFIYFQF